MLKRTTAISVWFFISIFQSAGNAINTTNTVYLKQGVDLANLSNKYKHFRSKTSHIPFYKFCFKFFKIVFNFLPTVTRQV